MALHNEIGKQGEELAANWLAEKGWQILERNWRYSHAEIDIIAFFESKLHFIEVKTRTGIKYGLPEDSVTAAKFRHLKKAASVYMKRYPQIKWIQFDIISILLADNKKPAFYLIQDFYL